jgi:hypothetical protein
VKTIRRSLAVALVTIAGISGCSARSDLPRPDHRPVVGYQGPPAAARETPLGAKWDWSRTSRFGGYLHALSGGGTFYEAVLCDLEGRPGQYDWASVDRVVRSTRRLGISLMLKVRIGTCWATKGRGGHARGFKTASAFPADVGSYREFVHALVSRYAPEGVHEYAVENEVNGQGMWDGTPAEYERLVRVAAGAIRAAFPRATVLDSGISSTAYGVAVAQSLLQRHEDGAAVDAYKQYYAARTNRTADFPPVQDAAQLQEVLRGQQARRDLDYLAATERLLRDRIVDVRQVHFYEPWWNVSSLLGYLRSTTPAQVPLEAWEVGAFSAGGADTATEAAHVDGMVKTITLLLGGGVRRVVWLPLAVDPTGRHAQEPRYGLLSPDGAVRLSGREFLQLADLARRPAVPVERGDLVGAAFGDSRQTSIIVWSRGPSVPVPDGVPSVKIQSLGGAVPASGQAWVGASPVLVTVDRPVDAALLQLGWRIA